MLFRYMIWLYLYGVGILGELTKLYAYGFSVLFQVLQMSWQGEGVTVHILVFWTYDF